MRRLLVPILAATVLGGCLSTAEDGARVESADRAALAAILDEYVAAVNAADADRLARLFWIDDPRFSEIEDHIPRPFGAKTFREIGDWIRANAKPGEKQRFRAARIFLLSPEVAYGIALQDLLVSETTSRVTLVFLKRDREWRIIHGHFSDTPSAD